MRGVKILFCAVVLLGIWIAAPDSALSTEKQENHKKDSTEKSQEKSQQPSKQAQILVETAPILKEMPNQSYPYIGSLSFSKKSSLASEVSGIIDVILVKEGERVKKGTPLAVLNNELLHNEILSKEASLKQAKAQLAKTKKD